MLERVIIDRRFAHRFLNDRKKKKKKKKEIEILGLVLVCSLYLNQLNIIKRVARLNQNNVADTPMLEIRKERSFPLTLISRGKAGHFQY